MVKRLRSVSVSSEPLPHAGPSNPAEDDAEAPRKRRRRGEPERGPLERLPPELRSQIILELVDPHDLSNSLKDIENLRRTGLTFNRDVAELMQDPDVRKFRASTGLRPAVPERRNGVQLEAGGTLFYNKTEFGDFLVPVPMSMTRAEIAFQDKAMKCDLISVASKNEKTDLTSEVLRFPDMPIKYDALDSLAMSVAYLEPHDRGTLVESICTLDKKLHEDQAHVYQGSRILSLIDNVEHLSPVAHIKLADAAFETPDPDRKAKYHEAFARNIDFISVRDTQERVVDAILQHNADLKGYRMGLLAEKLDKISDRSPQNTVLRSPRKKIVHAILDMGRADTGRLWAMSKLVEKLGSVTPETIREVTSVAVEELTRPIVETSIDQDRWRANPVTCRVEMAHHLSKNANLLTRGEAKIVSGFIEDVLSSTGNYKEKAQLLPHMEPKARRAFGEIVEKPLYPGDDGRFQIAKQIVEGMALRVKDLDEKEKSNLARRSRDLSVSGDQESLLHVISEKMPYFTRDDASYMANTAILLCEDKRRDLRNNARIFGIVASQAARLNGTAVGYCVTTARKIAADNVKDVSLEQVSGNAFRSVVIKAAQCVANNSRETLVKGMIGLEAKLNTELSDTRRGYDNRPNNLGR